MSAFVAWLLNTVIIVVITKKLQNSPNITMWNSWVLVTVIVMILVMVIVMVMAMVIVIVIVMAMLNGQTWVLLNPGMIFQCRCDNRLIYLVENTLG